MRPYSGRIQKTQQPLAIGRTDNRACRDDAAELAIPRYARLACFLFRVANPDAQRSEARHALLASADAPEIEPGQQRRRERHHDNRRLDRPQRDRAQVDREIRSNGLRQGFRGHRRLHLMILAMTPMPTTMLISAKPSMKRPRGSVNRTDIRPGLMADSSPQTINGRIARTAAEALVSDDSALGLETQGLAGANDAAEVGQRFRQTAARSALQREGDDVEAEIRHADPVRHPLQRILRFGADLYFVQGRTQLAADRIGDVPPRRRHRLGYRQPGFDCPADQVQRVGEHFEKLRPIPGLEEADQGHRRRGSRGKPEENYQRRIHQLEKEEEAAVETPARSATATRCKTPMRLPVAASSACTQANADAARWCRPGRACDTPRRNLRIGAGSS